MNLHSSATETMLSVPVIFEILPFLLHSVACQRDTSMKKVKSCINQLHIYRESLFAIQPCNIPNPTLFIFHMFLRPQLKGFHPIVLSVIPTWDNRATCPHKSISSPYDTIIFIFVLLSPSEILWFLH